jgi:hypothetical protein
MEEAVELLSSEMARGVRGGERRPGGRRGGWCRAMPQGERFPGDAVARTPSLILQLVLQILPEEIQ